MGTRRQVKLPCMCRSSARPETEGRLRATGPYASPLAKEDFHWSDETEPHATRRKEILAKHPEIRSLFGPDVYIMHQVFFVVALLTAVAYAMGAYDMHWGLLVLTSYWFGGFANHNLFLAVHELAHGL